MTNYCKHNIPREECEECNPEPDQGDLFEGRRRRDEGHDKLTLHGPEFTAAVAGIVRRCSHHGQKVTGEGVRLLCEHFGLHPHHHNAWGGATMKAVRDGLLVPTGEYEQMRDPRSHARETKVYRVNL